MDYKAFYEENKDFHDYVEHYRKNHGYNCEEISVDEAITHWLVQSVAQAIKNKSE